MFVVNVGVVGSLSCNSVEIVGFLSCNSVENVGSLPCNVVENVGSLPCFHVNFAWTVVTEQIRNSEVANQVVQFK